MSVSNYPEFFKIKSDVFLFSYFPFLFQLKSKHDYYNDDSIRLLMTFESGLEACNFINSYAGISCEMCENFKNILRNTSKRLVRNKIDETIIISVRQYSEKNCG